MSACVNNFQITALLTLMSTLIIFNSILLIIIRLRAQAGSENASLYFLPELENFDRSLEIPATRPGTWHSSGPRLPGLVTSEYFKLTL